MVLLNLFLNSISMLNIFQSTQRGCEQVISSSGGNAGMAAAYASKVMEIPATIVIPKSTPSFMISKLKQEKADVLVSNYCEVY